MLGVFEGFGRKTCLFLYLCAKQLIMDAVFKIKGEEFDEVLFKKIKALLRKNGSSVIIQVTDESEVYHRMLQQSINEMNEGSKLVSFALEDLVKYKPTKAK